MIALGFEVVLLALKLCNTLVQLSMPLVEPVLLMPNEGLVGLELQSSLLKARLPRDGSRPFRRHW